jgi:hypothetical protein
VGNVYPMRPIGAAEDSSELLTYVARDPIGTEDDAALPADWTGINEGGEWTERVEDAFEDEHDLYGLHHTLKVARGFAWIGWDGANWVTFSNSYLQGSTGNILRGSAAFSASGVGGVVTVALSIALPSVHARISVFPSRGRVGKSDPDLESATRRCASTTMPGHVAASSFTCT